MTDTKSPARGRSQAKGGDWRILAVVLVGSFMAVLDTTIVNVALPSIGQGVKASSDALEWVVSGYALTFGLALVPAGRLGDRFGYKQIFVAGLVVFTLASVACGVAQDPAELIAARLVQGLGAGLYFPAISATIQRLFSGRDRSRAFGYLGGVVGISTAAGPLIGGLLIQFAGVDDGWRWVFLVNLFIGAAELPVAIRLLPRRHEAEEHGLDLIGNLLLVVVLLLLLIPLSAWALVGPLILAGLGNGLVIAPNQDFVLGSVPRRQAGTAGGALTTAQRLGAAIGIAVIGTALFGSGGSGSSGGGSGSASKTMPILVHTAQWATAANLRLRRAGSLIAPPLPGFAKPREYLPGVELEEALNLAADLPDVDLVEAGLGEGACAGDMDVGIGPARRGDRVLGDQLRDLAEVPWQRQQLDRLAGDRVGRPEPVHRLARLPGVLAPADLQPALDRPLPSACLAVEADEIPVRLHAHVAVGDPRGEPDGLVAEPGHEDRRRLIRHRVQPRRLDRVVPPGMGDELAGQQFPDHVDRFLEHLHAFLGAGPPAAKDVLVQRLPGADAEGEPAPGQQRRCRGGLRHDGRVLAQQRAGHRRGHRQRRGLRYRADQGPHEPGLPLLVQPGVEVIGDPQGIEPGLFREPGLPDQLIGAVLLAGQEVTVAGHESAIPS
jgi:MFS family permease